MIRFSVLKGSVPTDTPGICAWPEGADPGSEDITLIKRSEITAVHFRGYENAVSQQLAKQLEKKRRGSLFTRIFGM